MCSVTNLYFIEVTSHSETKAPDILQGNFFIAFHNRAVLNSQGFNHLYKVATRAHEQLIIFIY